MWRGCAPRVLAVLTRRSGDFDAAEDAVQEALLDAAVQWPRDGVPDNPTGWLVRVAGRRLVDSYRSDAARVRREQAEAGAVPGPDRFAPAADHSLGLDADPAEDDTLALMALCCHPVLPLAGQVALTLRAVAGLPTRRIGRALLVPEATVAQRISRAKAELRAHGIRFGPLAPAELTARMPAVLQVLSLIFAEGHTASEGPALLDVRLADEALRLTREVHRLLPADDECTGLLALMLLQQARRTARCTADGDLVRLADQDRSRWDRARIREAVALLERVLPRGHVGPFQLQGAIAAAHAEAGRWEDTDWPQIVELYRMLDRIAPGPAVTVNLAVAVAMVDGAQAGLLLVDPMVAAPGTARLHRPHAVRAHLLDQLGRTAEAREEYLLAARLTTSIPEQRYLQARADDCR